MFVIRRNDGAYVTKSLIFTASYLLSALFVLKLAHVINISWLIVFIIVFSPMWLITAIILAAVSLAIIVAYINKLFYAIGMELSDLFKQIRIDNDI